RLRMPQMRGRSSFSARPLQSSVGTVSNMSCSASGVFKTIHDFTIARQSAQAVQVGVVFDPVAESMPRGKCALEQVESPFAVIHVRIGTCGVVERAEIIRLQPQRGLDIAARTL